MEKNIHKQKVLYTGQYIRLVQRENWEYIERHNCTGIVIIIAMTNDKKVVLTEQFRPPVQKRVIEFPAGLMNDRPSLKNESVLKAAAREFFEETGYKAAKMQKLMQGPVSGGSSADLVTLVLASGLKKVGLGGGDETEQIKVHTIPLAKIEGWLLKKTREGCLIEPKIYSGLYFLNKYNDVFKQAS